MSLILVVIAMDSNNSIVEEEVMLPDTLYIVVESMFERIEREQEEERIRLEEEERVRIEEEIAERERIRIEEELAEQERIREEEERRAALYDSYEAKLLSALIATESGSNWQSFEEQSMVAVVALNRLNDGRWGNTLEQVIRSPGQFEVVARGSFDSAMNSGRYREFLPQAVAALNNETRNPGYLYFFGDGRHNHFR